MSTQIVVCAACRRRLLWTYSGYVTCPAGHTALFRPPLAHRVRPMNTPFGGDRFDLFGGMYSDKVIEIDKGGAAQPLRQYWTPRKGSKA